MASHPTRTKRVKKKAEVKPNISGTARFSWIYLAAPAAAMLLANGNRDAITAIILVAIGLMLILERSMLIARPWIYGVAFALAAWGLTAWLPRFATLQRIPWWRDVITDDLGIPLAGTVAPQPWLSFEPVLLLVAGCLFAAHLGSLSFSMGARRKLMGACVVAVCLIALLSIASFFLGFHMPGWHSATGFGPFPNRNQTGNLFAIPIVAAAALGFDSFLLHRKLPGFLWLGAACLLLVAAVLTTSRAALGLAFGCVLLWCAYMVLLHRRESSAVAIAFSGALILGALVLAFGGKAVDRILPTTQIAEATPSLRQAMHKDVLQMSRAAPITGVGLGNFEAIFPFYRKASAAEERALHPDSDWLLVLGEMGWPGLLLCIAAAGFFFANVLPLGSRSDRGVRMAAAVAAAGFLLHGAFDICAHRPGTIFIALLLASAALHPGRDPERLRPTAQNLLRISGCLLLLPGIFFGGAACGLWPSPTAQTVRGLEEKAGKISDPVLSRQMADRALALAPLRWQLYFLKARSELLENDVTQARLNFRRVRFLEPFNADVALREGLMWWKGAPQAAFAAWNEALYRTRRNPHDMLGQILKWVGPFAPWSQEILSLSQVRRELWLSVLQNLEPAEFAEALQSRRQDDPGLAKLGSPQRKQLFQLWESKLGRATLVDALQRQPGWEDEGWFWLTRDLAARGFPSEAVARVKARLGAPPIPATAAPEDPQLAESRWDNEPQNFAIPLSLIEFYRKSGKPEEAFRIITTLESRAGASMPPYFLWLKSEIAGTLGRWDVAWQSVDEYITRMRLQ